MEMYGRGAERRSHYRERSGAVRPVSEFHPNGIVSERTVDESGTRGRSCGVEAIQMRGIRATRGTRARWKPVTGRRRRAPERKRGPRRKTYGQGPGLLLGAGVLVAAGAVGVTVTLWPVGDTGTGTGGDSASTGAPRASDAAGAASSAPAAGSRTPSPPPPPRPPPASYPLSNAPRTIPAVREHIPARGPGWRPRPTARCGRRRRSPRRRGEAARRRAEDGVRRECRPACRGRRAQAGPGAARKGPSPTP